MRRVNAHLAAREEGERFAGAVHVRVETVVRFVRSQDVFLDQEVRAEGVDAPLD